MNVYDPNAFEDRVNYAASVISKGRMPENSRTLDTCFEMFDGEFVAAALVRRAKKNPATKFAQNIFKILAESTATRNYEETKHMTRRELRETALKHVAEMRGKFGI